MEILSSKNRQELLNYLPHIKSALPEWIFVEVRLMERSNKDFTINDAARLIHSSFEEKEGKIYVCNSHEILLLLRSGSDRNSGKIEKKVGQNLPPGSCEAHVHELTPEGIAKFEMLIGYRKPFGLSDLRCARPEKIILVADDDLYMRLLIKKGCGDGFTVYEIADGKNVLKAYDMYMPNIIFLDTHMPNMNGASILRDILARDPKAYIVVLGGDGPRGNPEPSAQQGIKGFLTKPYTSEKLLDYIRKCPTIG